VYIWDEDWGEGAAVNMANLESISVSGSGSTWGIQGSASGGSVSIAPNGTYGTKDAAVDALLALLRQAGYSDLP
jgi:hypothetical protein